MKFFQKVLAIIFSAALIPVSCLSAVVDEEWRESVIPFQGPQFSVEAETEQAIISGGYIRVEDETASDGVCLQADPSAPLHMSTPSGGWRLYLLDQNAGREGSKFLSL